MIIVFLRQRWDETLRVPKVWLTLRKASCLSKCCLPAKHLHQCFLWHGLRGFETIVAACLTSVPLLDEYFFLSCAAECFHIPWSRFCLWLMYMCTCPAKTALAKKK